MRSAYMFADEILLSLLQATVAGMKVVKVAQRTLVSDAVAKSDGTYVTKIDEASEAAALPFLHATGLDVWAEEAGHSGVYTTNEVVFFDPLDGTRIFLLGGSSATVIAATYDLGDQMVTRAVVGEAVSGRMWFAARGCGTWMFYAEDIEAENAVVLESFAQSACKCNVWDEAITKNPTVFMDLTSTFQKPGYPPIHKGDLAQFFCQVFDRYDVCLQGSNGLHHAMVAQGGIGATAAVTTAIGFPGDVVPALLVLEAGGAARAFNNGSEVNPLSVTEYNLLVTGNTPAIVDDIVGQLLASLY